MAYTFHSFKGQGGFARVDIVSSDSGQLFAKKTYQPQPQLISAVGDDHLKRRFIREVSYQKSVDHPNIVRVIEDSLNEETPSFIMPLAECTLKDELQVNPTLGTNLHTALFDILSGLEFLHSKGFIHRDLKPANVLRFNIGGAYRYVISDFGLMSASNSDSSTLTGTNANGGTENYAAPELIGNFKRATASADIYAFGAILHDIFSNTAQRVPYTELSVSGSLGPIVEKCTKKLPIRRYKNVSELRDELYQVLNNAEVSFTSTSEEVVVNILRGKNDLTDEEWDNVFIQIDLNLNSNLGITNIITAISLAHIKALAQTAPDLFSALGEYFSDCIQNSQFDFDYCDVLASKSELFFLHGDLGLKAKIAISTLALGVRHNRWYVERKASAMLNKSISIDLAERIKIEIEVRDISFAEQVQHLSASIGLSSDFLHPVLRAKLC